MLSIGAFSVSAQKKPAATGQSIWQEFKLEKWGFTFSAPKDLRENPNAEKPNPNLSDEDFSESKTYRRSTPKAKRLEISINLRSVKGETIKTERNGKPVELKTDELLLLDYIADREGAKSADSPVLEAKVHEIDEVTGSLTVMNASFKAGKSIKPTNDIRVAWGTYRLFKGNVNQIIFVIEGKRTQLETMLKIINSLKFSK